MESVDFTFHRLSSRQFEDVAASVLQDKFRIPLLTFSDGRDGGRDASARHINLRIGDKKLRKKNIVVQVKHTRVADSVLDDGVRHRLFRAEVCKVVSLAEEKELDVYFIVLNFRVPAGQEKKLVQMFRSSGCKHVYVIGTEMLVRWIRESRKLGEMLWRLYGLGGPTTHEMFNGMTQQVLDIRRQLQVVLTKAEVPQRDLTAGHNELVRQQLKHMKTVNNTNKVVKQIQQDLQKKSNCLNRSLSSLEKPVRSLSRSVSCTQETVQALAYTVQKNQRTLDAMRKTLTKATSDTQHYTKTRKPSLAAGQPSKINAAAELRKAHYGVTCDLLMTLTSDPSVLGSWRFLVRSLGVSETVVREAAYQSGTLREQAYQALRAWSVECDRPGALGELLVALRTWSLNRAADLVEKKMQETQRTEAPTPGID